jgi:Golgi nucleoside diphosphatase
MRVLKQDDRFRVMAAVRTLFSNDTFCPFQFVDEHARVISGEEEAVFGWTGINFAMGTLIKASEGAGAVLNPRLTYGALDMGGASTQISFYDPSLDIMSNLFKLQIGQGKHWNLYAHSFLWYGINEAKNRLEARLINDMNATTRLAQGVYNPCLPGQSDKLVRTQIFIDKHGYETWNYTGTDVDKDGYHVAILRNPHKRGDPDACMSLAYEMLHKSQDEWCEFSHRGDCSFAGVYQPALPKQSKHFGEFLAFSNYYHVWDFLNLPMRSSLADLENRTRYACSLSETELLKFNDGRIDESLVHDFCFHSSFVFQVLHNGYGFKMDDYITATNVVNGQKVGWALGAMMYEINTMPWLIEDKRALHVSENASLPIGMVTFFLVVVISMLVSIFFVFYRHHKVGGRRAEYTPINR